MAEASPVARSPIAPTPPEVVVDGWVVSARVSAAALTLTDLTPLAKVSVKASWDGSMAELLGVRFGRAARLSWDLAGSPADVLVTATGPGEWLVLAEPGRQRAVVSWLDGSAARSDELVTVVDLTHGRALMRLAGTSSAGLLNKECSLDLTDTVCPNGSALRSAVSGVATDIVRDDRDGVPSYLLNCERSSGQYLFDSLLDAGHELGVDIDGFAPQETHS